MRMRDEQILSLCPLTNDPTVLCFPVLLFPALIFHAMAMAQPWIDPERGCGRV